MVKNQQIALDKLGSSKEEQVVDKPNVFSTEMDWRVWKIQIETYLRSLKGVDNVPLVYVIRDEDEALPYEKTTHMTSSERLVAGTPLQGTFWDKDNKHVYLLLSTRIFGSSWTVMGPGRP
jgi:hypothetical protein